MRLMKCIVALGLLLAVTIPAGAVTLDGGTLVFKTFNWEVSTTYAGTDGITYFRDASSSYVTATGATVAYDLSNPNHRLFSDSSFTIIRPDDKGLMTGEDSWGLLQIRELNNTGPLINGGTDIGNPTGDAYWNAGDGGKSLLGMFYGGQDQAVKILDANTLQIYSSNLQYVLREATGVPADPIAGGLLPVSRTVADEFTGWTVATDPLEAKGTGTWFRFVGDTSSVPAGATQVYLTVDSGAWDPFLQDGFYTAPNGDPSAIKQEWQIGSGSTLDWVGSTDTAKGYVIPEPMTMIGLFLAVGGIGGYIRRRMA